MAEWAHAIAQGLGAAADTGAQVIGDQIKNSQQLQQQQQLERDAADVKFDLSQRMAAADLMMKQQAVARFEAARSGIIDQKMGQKYGQSDAAVADADAGNTDAPLTDEQKAVIAQAKMADSDRLGHDQDVLVQAGLQSGAISPEQAATFTNKSDLAQMHMENFKSRTEMMGQIAQTRAEAMRDVAQARLDAARDRIASGNGNTRDQANVAQVEYLMNKRGLPQQQALDLVYGNGEAAHKSTEDRASAMAASLINSGQVRVTKDDPPGTNVASKAIKMARAALDGGPAVAAPAGNTVPNPFAPGKPKSDPLGLFGK